MPKKLKHTLPTHATEFRRPDLTLKQLARLIELRFGPERDFAFPMRSCQEVADICGLLKITVVRALIRLRNQNYAVRKKARQGRPRKPILSLAFEDYLCSHAYLVKHAAHTLR